MVTWRAKLYTHLPHHKKVEQPCFRLKVIKLPQDYRYVRKASPKFAEFERHEIERQIEEMGRVKNLHTILHWDPKTNFRRQSEIARVRPWFHMEGAWRELYLQGQKLHYVFHLKPCSLFAQRTEIMLQTFEALQTTGLFNREFFQASDREVEVLGGLTNEKRAKFNKMIGPKFKGIALSNKNQTGQSDQLLWAAKYAVLNCEDEAKLIDDCRRVLGLIENPFSDLSIVLNNRMSRDKQALRLIKKECREQALGKEVETACSLAVFWGQQSSAAPAEFCRHVLSQTAGLSS